MTDWLKSITEWLVKLIKSILGFVADLVRDAVVWVLDAILGPLGDMIAAIPAPGFLSSTNFGGLLSGLPPFALYVIQNCRLTEALLIIGAGVSFNLARKLFTLGQW